MTVPAYTTDLLPISNGEEATGYTEPTGALAGAITMNNADFFIQGTACCSKTQLATGYAGMIYNSGAAKSLSADGGVFTWMFYSATSTLATEASGGFRVIMGSATSAFRHWYVRGSDTYAYGGWICVPVDPLSVSGDTTDTGSPNMSSLQYFGTIAYVPGPNFASKGDVNGLDAIRYGRGEARIAYGSTADGYATFLGYSLINDSVTNRWGLIQAQSPGVHSAGYSVQGLVVFGYGVATDFRDSNTSININNTKKVSANFNGFEVRNASSRVDLTAISFTALGTVSRGRWITTDDADINITGCTFTDMATFGFLPNSTISTSIFRRTDKITTGGATFSSCTFDNNRATTAVLAASPSAAELITGCSFISDGTGHGLEIGGTAANMALTNNTWTGYTAATSGNEAVYVNIPSGSMNLTITGGTIPSVRTAGAIVTIVAGAVSATVTVKDSSVPPVAIAGARVLVVADAGGPMPSNVTVTSIVNDGTTATVTHTAHGMLTNDKVQIKGASLLANNGVYSITKLTDNSYSYTMGSSPGSSPTGTIKATYVALSGLTSAGGTITMSRVFTSSQPILGRVRKTTDAPYYKTANIVGSIDSAAGFSTTVQMLLDQ